MRFFSKIVFICNLCFIAAAILRLIEVPMRKAGNVNNVIPLPAVEATIVILGFIVAIILNVIFVILLLYKKSFRQIIPISTYLILFNVILLPIQIWYSFLMKY